MRCWRKFVCNCSKNARIFTNELMIQIIMLYDYLFFDSKSNRCFFMVYCCFLWYKFHTHTHNVNLITKLHSQPFILYIENLHNYKKMSLKYTCYYLYYIVVIFNYLRICKSIVNNVKIVFFVQVYLKIISIIHMKLNNIKQISLRNWSIQLSFNY